MQLKLARSMYVQARLAVQWFLVSAIPDRPISPFARSEFLGSINLLVNLVITLITDISAATFKNRLVEYTFTPTPTLNMPQKPIFNAERQAIRHFY